MVFPDMRHFPLVTKWLPIMVSPAKSQISNCILETEEQPSPAPPKNPIAGPHDQGNNCWFKNFRAETGRVERKGDCLCVWGTFVSPVPEWGIFSGVLW